MRAVLSPFHFIDGNTGAGEPWEKARRRTDGRIPLSVADRCFLGKCVYNSGNLLLRRFLGQTHSERERTNAYVGERRECRTLLRETQFKSTYVENCMSLHAYVPIAAAASIDSRSKDDRLSGVER